MKQTLDHRQLEDLRTILKSRARQLREEIRQTLVKSDDEQYTMIADQVRDLEDDSFADLMVDVTPRGKMLVLSNADEPGMIGQVGTLLGRHQVNIADMRVGRRAPHGEAVMVITVDEDAPPALLSELKALKGIRTVRSVVL